MSRRGRKRKFGPSHEAQSWVSDDSDNDREFQNLLRQNVGEDEDDREVNPLNDDDLDYHNEENVHDEIHDSEVDNNIDENEEHVADELEQGDTSLSSSNSASTTENDDVNSDSNEELEHDQLNLEHCPLRDDAPLEHGPLRDDAPLEHGPLRDDSPRHRGSQYELNTIIYNRN